MQNGIPRTFPLLNYHCNIGYDWGSIECGRFQSVLMVHLVFWCRNLDLWIIGLRGRWGSSLSWCPCSRLSELSWKESSWAHDMEKIGFLSWNRIWRCPTWRRCNTTLWLRRSSQWSTTSCTANHHRPPQKERYQ